MNQLSAMDGADALFPGEQWSVGTLLSVLRRRRSLLVRAIVFMIVAAALYCALATRRYRATGEIQVQREASGAFGLESSVMGRSDGSVSSDSLDYNITLQTEAGILASDSFALDVIRDLHLEATPDYSGVEPGNSAGSDIEGIKNVLRSALFWRKPLEPLSTPLADAPNRRYKALKIFASHLKVQPVTGTRLIEVSYSDPDPKRAAAIVNHLLTGLGDFTFQQRFNRTLQGSSWLTGQLADLKRQMQGLQAKAISLQRDTGIFGSDGSHNVVLERLESLNQTLAQAESNRILKEAVDRVAASGDPELISSLAGNAGAGAMSAVTNTLTLIQSLRAQQASLRAELAQDSVRYGAAYPRLGELQAQLDGVQHSIEEEVRRLGARAHSDYLVAARSEAGARSAFEQQRKAAGRLNDSVLAYGLAKQEADSSRDIYEGLLAKLKQAGVLEGLKASNISIVSAAQVPPPLFPSSPRTPLILAVAALLGLLMGTTAIIGLELTDNKVRSFEGMERELGIALVAVLPAVERAGLGRRPHRGIFARVQEAAAWTLAPVRNPRAPLPVAALDQQPSTFAEGLRSLRTSLMLSRSGRPPQVVLITSCLEGEGKTTLALNLAAMLAQQGSRVLLVDADLRRPGLSAYFAGGPTAGLAAGLAGASAVETRRPIELMPNLAVVCGDEVPPFPSELLGSLKMRSLLEEWKAEYDFIVLDSPPVLPVTDAVLLSQISDATLLVARHGQTPRQALRRSAEILRKQHPGHAALGMVLNGVMRGSGDFYEYFGFEGGLHAGQSARA